MTKEKISDRIIRYVIITFLVFMGILSFLGVMYVLEIIDGDNRVSQSYDAGWHEGINQCSEYWDLSSNEKDLINMYRMKTLVEANKDD